MFYNMNYKIIENAHDGNCNTVVLFGFKSIVDCLPDNLTIAIKIHLYSNDSCSIAVYIYLENNGCVISRAFKRFPFVKRAHQKARLSVSTTLQITG